VLVLSVVILEKVSERTVESSMDAVTGTMRWRTSWVFGITSRGKNDVSPLEARLKTRGIAWTPSWRSLSSAHLSFLECSRACGTAPPIYQLQPVLKEFVAVSTDQELRQFVRVMQAGTEAEQRAAVNDVVVKILGP